MRNKDKIFCDNCGKFLFKLTKKQMDEVNKKRLEGTMISSNYLCKECSKRWKTNKIKNFLELPMLD